MRVPPPACLPIACLATLLAACSTNVRDAAPAGTTTRVAPIAVPEVAHPQGETAGWWYRSGAARAAANGAMGGKAKNVIVFLGDGMSLTTVAAARILDGQRKGGPGEGNRLAWETFPATALSRTYNTDAQTPDSAGTMSAIATGVKTFMGSISVGPASRNDDCAGSLDNRNLTWLELAQSAGMATGVVSTARLTHATPAATYAHVPTRGWENDTDLPAEAVQQGCRDIARQFVETPFGGPIVALGGGRAEFMPQTTADPVDADEHGSRGDGRDLTAEWRAAHPQGAFVWNAQQLRDAADAPRLFGLFDRSHMEFDHDRDTSPQGQPSLEEMTRAAIHTLSRDPDGYVLLVEGARIDMANHYGNAFRALDETIAMSRAVQAAMDMTSADDTLILVTADHSHTLNFVGYPVRGNPILGKVRGKSEFDGKPGELAKDGLGLPYTTLGYANGPGYTGASSEQPAGSKRFPHMGKGYKPATGRPDLTDVDTADPDYMQESTVPMSSESHGGEDVGIWALGPGSEAVRGSVEQNVIYHVIVQATPKLRERLCAAGTCNADGVPVELPSIDAFVPGK
ncbi:alkaline phosphatase [Luteimonas lutimaris]|uniref:Alkaline phosphatase n=1 Tax=Luteimonas lutimaris TaxID=698645 RepID=A0ABP7MER9_9GAMM